MSISLALLCTFCFMTGLVSGIGIYYSIVDNKLSNLFKNYNFLLIESKARQAYLCELEQYILKMKNNVYRK